MNPIRTGRPARGGTLIEVLIAMAILALLMVGILQLFSLSLLTDSGSAARTDMTLKAQQVAENLRYLHFLRKQGGAMPADTLLPGSPSNGLKVDLPWQATDTGWAYWGPAGANVFEQERPPYRISYTYSASTTATYWFVTVTVTSENTATGMNYIGSGAKVKRVDYVCQVPQ
jgi:prepilin-type N-terminal cleavage/methylation domain-containing protein